MLLCSRKSSNKLRYNLSTPPVCIVHSTTSVLRQPHFKAKIYRNRRNIQKPTSQHMRSNLWIIWIGDTGAVLIEWRNCNLGIESVPLKISCYRPRWAANFQTENIVHVASVNNALYFWTSLDELHHQSQDVEAWLTFIGRGVEPFAELEHSAVVGLYLVVALVAAVLHQLPQLLQATAELGRPVVHPARHAAPLLKNTTGNIR